MTMFRALTLEIYQRSVIPLSQMAWNRLEQAPMYVTGVFSSEAKSKEEERNYPLEAYFVPQRSVLQVVER